MIRRNARLRREYLYRKGLEGKEKAAYEKKRLVRKALEGTLPLHPLFNRELLLYLGAMTLRHSSVVASAPLTHVQYEQRHCHKMLSTILCQRRQLLLSGRTCTQNIKLHRLFLFPLLHITNHCPHSCAQRRRH